MPRFGILLSLVLFGASLATAPRPARAAVKEFPYEAVVEADETYVRCGPGKNFYTTTKLTRGQHVTVRRHDPGGWFMIDPPAGSFSLIRVEDVVQEGNIATVKRLDQGQACVRIGSAVDPTNDSIFQRKLSTGERAEILGEVMIPRKDRTVPMFRIRPPRGEYRWIEGNDLAPLDPQIKQQQDNDPFTTPPRSQEARNDRQTPPAANATTIALSTTTASTSTTRTNSINGATNRTSGQPGKGKSGAGATTTTQKGRTPATQQVVIGAANFDPRGRLDQIDVEFRDMIQKDPPSWNLGQIEQAYLELRQNPAAAGVANQVDLRFSALSHYKQVKAEYDDYYRLVSNTSRRDAELAAVESSLAPQNSRPAIGPAPQDAVATTTPGDPNFRQPTTASNGLPTLSVPGYGNQPNAAWQSSADGQQSSQSQYPQSQSSPSQYPQAQYPQPQVGQQQFPQAQGAAVAVRVVVSATGRFAVRRPGLVAPVFTAALTASTRTTPGARSGRSGTDAARKPAASQCRFRSVARASGERRRINDSGTQQHRQFAGRRRDAGGLGLNAVRTGTTASNAAVSDAASAPAAEPDTAAAHSAEPVATNAGVHEPVRPESGSAGADVLGLSGCSGLAARSRADSAERPLYVNADSAGRTPDGSSERGRKSAVRSPKHGLSAAVSAGREPAAVCRPAARYAPSDATTNASAIAATNTSADAIAAAGHAASNASARRGAAKRGSARRLPAQRDECGDTTPGRAPANPSTRIAAARRCRHRSASGHHVAERTATRAARAERSHPGLPAGRPWRESRRVRRPLDGDYGPAPTSLTCRRI